MSRNVCLKIVWSVIRCLCKGREVVGVSARSEAPEMVLVQSGAPEIAPASPIDISTLLIWTREVELQLGRDVPVEEGMSKRYIRWWGGTRMERMKGVHTLSEGGDTADGQTLSLVVWRCGVVMWRLPRPLALLCLGEWSLGVQ